MCRHRIVGSLAASIAACVGDLSVGVAQPGYPNKPIRLVIPFPPGGASDILARTIADRLSDSLKQRVAIDNRPGGGGLIAIENVAGASGDGHTLLQIAASFVINPSLYRKLPYHPEKDFVPISPLAVADNVIVVHPSLPLRSVAELVRFARARPGQLNYAHTGYGTQAYLAAELFKQTVRVDMLPVPYKGTPGALLDLIAGEVHLMFAGLPPTIPHLRSAKLRAIGVTGTARVPELPDVAVVADTLPGFEASVWYGLLAPAGTPREVITRLNAETARILRNAEVKARLGDFGFRTLEGTSDEFAAFMKREGEKWAKVIRASGTKVSD